MIADFGLAKLKNEDETSKSRLRGGEQDYLSPEAFDEVEWQNGTVGRALDIWAFGCILTEFSTYLQGGSVEAFKEARRSTHRHDYFQITDSAFHLNRRLRPAVNDWLLKLMSESPKPETSKLIDLSRELLNPSWRLRIEISAVVERLGAISLDSKVAASMECFLQLVSSPNKCNQRSRIFMLLERKRLLAWYQAYISTDGDTKRVRLKQSLAVAEQLRACLETYTGRHGEIGVGSDGPQIPPDIQVVCDIIDKLGVDLPKHVQQEMDQLWAKSVLEVDDADLERMRGSSMPSRYRTVGIKAAVKYMSGAISKATREHAYRPGNF
jgi:serine/threonine protein kinase